MLEPMAEFFEARLAGYDEHMLREIEVIFKRQYKNSMLSGCYYQPFHNCQGFAQMFQRIGGKNHIRFAYLFINISHFKSTSCIFFSSIIDCSF